MKAWCGELLADGTFIVKGKTPEELAAWCEGLDSRTTSKDIDLSALATLDDYKGLMHETAMLLARKRISAMLSGRDLYIIQSINALDDANASYNRITERLAEWYGVHFPELRKRPAELITFIIEKGPRENTGDPRASSSIGAPMTPEDSEIIRSFARAAQTLLEERRELERYIASSMESFAPNLSDVAGPLLGARLIARAGSMEKLAKLPASTIQVMGAGEALFKHLREKTPPPKHGLIFQHPLIQSSPKPMRGKIARMIAAKVAIASRVDYYSGEKLELGARLRNKASALKSKGRRHER